MKADFKKRLIKIQNELEELRQDHEMWMGDHDYDNWEYSPAGERASEEQSSFDSALDELSYITNFDPRN